MAEQTPQQLEAMHRDLDRLETSVMTTPCDCHDDMTLYECAWNTVVKNMRKPLCRT